MDTVSPRDCGLGIRQLPTTSKQAKTAILILCLFAIVGEVQAESYQLKVSLGADDFLGVCSGAGLNDFDGDAWGECIGNFVNPTIPNPVNALSPITGQNLQDKIDAVNIINPLMDLNAAEFLEKFINIPLVLIGSIIELIASSITYLLVFAVKFIFVYMFYVSLGLQSILLMMDSNSSGIQNISKVHISLGIMGVASILALTYGGGWIAW